MSLEPRYPIYVISKGRWYNPLTVKALERAGAPYTLVIEPQELDEYRKVVNPDRIRTLPFSNRGQGSIPARNWVWKTALAGGHKRHWIMDDNIRAFYRFNHGMRLEVESCGAFRAVEDFVDRYENVAIAGLQYKMFAVPHKDSLLPAFTLNTRVYSCILILNELPYRWRGRYNEDTDLSLRALKDGWCTVLFYFFLADKIGTLLMKGGNTDELYAGDSTSKESGRYKMAQTLIDIHPDVVRMGYKYHRWQHEVNYKRFKHNRLQLKPGMRIPNEVNNYGMVLKTFAEDE